MRCSPVVELSADYMLNYHLTHDLGQIKVSVEHCGHSWSTHKSHQLTIITIHNAKAAESCAQGSNTQIKVNNHIRIRCLMLITAKIMET